ncbi:MAG: DUF1684 domain-containing protein [bacterium]
MIFMIPLLLFFGLFGSGDDESKIYYQIQKHRIEKDRLFRKSDSSPLPGKDKKQFQGLKYYPIDLKYRFEVTLHKYEEAKTIKIITSVGTLRDALKYGYFQFNMEGKECKLQVYKMLDVQGKFPNYLFVPFMDVTTGKGSYSGGRYIDLVENDSGVYILDFNMAYNPYCAYGKEGYVCPIPPVENRLDVEVRAGEKNYAKSTH